MKKSVVVALMILCLTIWFGVATVVMPRPAHIFMPIRILDTDIPRLIVLSERGGSYTRFAKPDGTMGITAVRQSDGTWVVPTEEVANQQ